MRDLKPKKAVLDNGATVLSVRLPHLASSHVVASLRSGPVTEDEETWGMSHLLEHMVFRGTKKHKTTRAVSLAADDFGGEIGGTTYRDRVVYDTRVDAGREDEALGLLAEMLASPRFEGLEVEKDVLQEELLELYNDDGDEIDADNLAARRVFDGHALARSIEGTLDKLDGWKAPALRRFHRDSYGPEHLVLVGAGPVSHRAFVESARAAFGGLPAGGGPRAGAAPPPLKTREPALVVEDEASQTQLRLSFPCGGLHSEDRWPLAVLARVLDDGPAARFPARLIDEEGIAYSLWCDTDLYEDRGAIEVGAQVAHDRVAEAVDAVCRELALVASRAPGRPEIERIVRRLERDLLDMGDDPCQVAESAARGEMVGVPLDPARVLERVRGVSGADVRRVARQVLRAQSATLVLVGLPSRRQARKAQEAVAALG
jgi:predicted Zn-dependent peptidase